MRVSAPLLVFHAAGLVAQPQFWTSTTRERAQVCNGAGAAHGLKFPNTFYGLNVRIAFDIHDWDYTYGPKTLRWKQEADRRMLTNLLMLIELLTTEFPVVGAVLRWLRRYRATTYYNAVAELGREAFNDGRPRHGN